MPNERPSIPPATPSGVRAAESGDLATIRDAERAGQHLVGPPRGHPARTNQGRVRSCVASTVTTVPASSATGSSKQ